jgi:hypothetical protein
MNFNKLQTNANQTKKDDEDGDEDSFDEWNFLTGRFPVQRDPNSKQTSNNTKQTPNRLQQYQANSKRPPTNPNQIKTMYRIFSRLTACCACSFSKSSTILGTYIGAWRRLATQCKQHQTNYNQLQTNSKQTPNKL